MGYMFKKKANCGTNGLNTGPKLSLLWQRSVVAGTFWGTFEIVLGSTLHNLMIPMAAGTVLSFMGVLIMSAISAKQIQRGLFWRAALVCALLKSVSPSAVILTPMLGIMLEGICLELGVLLFGRNVAGLIIGGGLAVFSVPAFRVVRLFLMYGSNIYELYVTVFSNKSVDVNDLQVSIWPIVGVTLLYFIIGVLAVLLGLSAGRTLNIDQVQYNLVNADKEQQLNNGVGSAAYRPILYFVIHLVFLVAFIGFSSILTTFQVLMVAAVYIAVCLWFYPRTRFVFKKKWLLITIILFSYAIPLIGADSISNLSWLNVGSRVFARALIVVISFAAIGTELGKPNVGKLFSGGFFQPAYLAVSLAFSSLPESLEQLKNFRLHGTKPLQQIRNMLVHSIRHTDRSAGCCPVIIVCGERGEGKTTFIKQVVDSLVSRNVRLVGFYAKGEGNPNLREGYNMVQLPNLIEHELCKRVGSCGDVNSSFVFNEQSIALGDRILDNATDGEVVIMDEIGRLELQGQVWSNALSKVLAKNQNPVIIAVRKPFLHQVIEKWSIKNPYILDINSSAAENVLKILNMD